MGIRKETLDLAEKRKAELKRAMPEVFTEGKVDFNKLREALGDLVEPSGERYSFSWAGRTEAFRTRDKPSKATLTPVQKESVAFDETKNVFIEGDNLEVLKILLKSYEGKVKMIYIDPPYNTGKDFVYKDDFKDPLKNYLKQTGQMNEKGEKTATNTETSGRYHSNWLTMMYPRLAIARNLLSEDGVIFISIDDNEVHNLRLVMNEIFGEENFVATIIWQKKYSPQNDATYFSDMHDFIICFAKLKKEKKEQDSGWSRNLLVRSEKQNQRYSNPDNDSRGPWKPADFSVKTYSEAYDYTITTPSGRKVNPPKGRCWATSETNFMQWIKEKRIWFGKNGSNVPAVKIFLSEVQSGVVPTTIWLRAEAGDNQDAKQELNALFGFPTFDTPKPTKLMEKIIQIASQPNSSDIILDFFAGSGTTAHAVLAQNAEDGGNRKFILVQLPEPTPPESEARKAGYKTIADICKERIRRVIKKLKTEGKQQKIVPDAEKQDLGFKAFKLSKSNCFIWDSEAVENPNTLAWHIEESAKGAGEAEPEALVFELMLREGFALDSEVSREKHGKNEFYKVTDDRHALWMCFDSRIDDEAVRKLGLAKDDKLIMLDAALSDTQKVNLARRMRVETV